MERFSELRVRYAKTLCRMMDFGMSREESPRPLRIASVLLMISASENLDNLVSGFYLEIKNAAVKSMTEIKKSDFKSVSKYVNLLNDIGALTLSIVNFLRTEKEIENNSQKGDSELLVKFITHLNNSLQNIKDISDSVKLRQGKQLYGVFEHSDIHDATEEMIHSIESRKVVEILKERGAKEVAEKINKAKESIERQLRNAERLSKMKERQGAPILDTSEDVDLISGAA